MHRGPPYPKTGDVAPVAEASAGNDAPTVDEGQVSATVETDKAGAGAPVADAPMAGDGQFGAGEVGTAGRRGRRLLNTKKIYTQVQDQIEETPVD